MFNYYLVELLQWWVALYLAGFKAWGLICGASLMAMALLRNTRFWAIFSVPAVLAALVALPLLLALPLMTEYLTGRLVQLPLNHAYWFLAGFLVPILAFVCVTSFASQSGGRTDIRSVAETLPGILQEAYDPAKYFDAKKGVFIGLNVNKKPIFIPTAEWRKSHCQIMGTTGAGKGVAAGVLLTQAVVQGESVIVIDPKNDEFLPLVMASAAKDANIKFVYLDLTGSKAQWSPFEGKSEQELEELLTAGFGMADTGSDADVYRSDDRRAARRFAMFCSRNVGAADEQFSGFYSANPDLIGSAKKFYADFEELISTPCIQASEGVDLPALLAAGAVIYVRGSTRNPRILKLQKIFLLSCMQIIEARDRDTARHVALFLDEFKYVLSRSAIEALGTIRDKRAHVIVAHQSLGDLQDCGDDLTPQAVIGGVVENCAIKLAYKVRDPATADWLSRMSGTMLFADESRTIAKDSGLRGERLAHRTLRQAERPLIDVNQLLMLPQRTAVLFGVGRARFIYTSPMRIDKHATAIEQEGEEVYATPDKHRSLADNLLDVD